VHPRCLLGMGVRLLVQWTQNAARAQLKRGLSEQNRGTRPPHEQVASVVWAIHMCRSHPKLIALNT
jgi:predicted transcriptional regulator